MVAAAGLTAFASVKLVLPGFLVRLSRGENGPFDYITVHHFEQGVAYFIYVFLATIMKYFKSPKGFFSSK
jgi:hypothetical protein